MTADATARIRLDKWLFFARVVKSRTLAAALANAGHVKVNSVKADKASLMVKPGDVLTINLERAIRIYRVVDCGERRGPAPEAQMLYEDLSPPPLPRAESPLEALAGKRDPGTGRPTKRERRELDRLRDE